VFFVIELATRRIEIAGITPNPNEAWVMQIGRNLTDPLDGFLDRMRPVTRRAAALLPPRRCIASSPGAILRQLLISRESGQYASLIQPKLVYHDALVRLDPPTAHHGAFVERQTGSRPDFGSPNGLKVL
jgi:hypothetical protein